MYIRRITVSPQAKCGRLAAIYSMIMTPKINKEDPTLDTNNIVRFLLTFFLGWIGSLIINHTSLKPEGYTSRTLAYLFLSIITFGIYGLVASICNLLFDPKKPKNIGYAKD